jgi:HAT1-interacting factor 1
LSFSGDPEDEEDPAVDLFAEASKPDEDEAGDVGGEEGEGEGPDEAEPEDDFNAAWEVLDLARSIYEKQMEGDGNDEMRLKVADTFIMLGDVSLETGASHIRPFLFFFLLIRPYLLCCQRSLIKPSRIIAPGSR